MSSTPDVALPGGLVLRTAQERDRAQIEALLLDRGAPGDDIDHRLVVDDPDAGWSSCAVVVDGHRVVSTATLLDEHLTLAGVRLPAGQVELVATARDHEGRGLVRALMAWAHRRSADRGHLLQVMIGIPYFYRLFGYDYAIDIPPTREVDAVPPARATLRPAAADDVPALLRLQQRAQAHADVTMPHSRPRWRWLLGQTTSALHVAARDGEVVAAARVRPDADEVLVAEHVAADHEAADALLCGIAHLARARPIRVVDRPGTETMRTWRHRLRRPPAGLDQYYVRIPDRTALLRAVQPVLEDRADDAGLAPGPVTVSTFGAHHTWTIADDGTWSDLTVGGTMQAPGVHGALGVAPDAVAALLFGQRGLRGLAEIRPDVYAGAATDRYAALFPPLTADLLTFYLPH